MDLIGHVPQIAMEAEVLRGDGSIIKSTSIERGFSECDVDVTIEDKDGNERWKQEFPFESFVHNWNRIYQYGFNSVTNASDATTMNALLNKNGNASFAQPNYSARINASSGVASFGVVLGANDASAGYDGNINDDEVHANDHKLRRQIKTNASLSHGKTNIILGSNQNEIIISRSFVNELGVTMKIGEIGIIGLGQPSGDLILLSRDIKDKNGNRLNISLGASETIRVKFRFKITSTSEGGFVANYVKLLKSDLRRASEAVVKTNGVETGLDFWSSTASGGKAVLSAGAGETTYGILVGNGNLSGIVGISVDDSSLKRQPASVRYTDFQLNNAITTLTHSAHTAINLTTEYPSFNKVASMFGVRRDFTNDGSTNILVNEIALVVRNVDGGSNNVMIVRYALPENLLIAEGEILRVRFYFKNDVFSKSDVNHASEEV